MLRRGALSAALGLAGLERRAQLAQLIGHALVLGACLVERACHVADVLVRLADLPLGVGASCGGGFFGERCAPNGLGALALGRRDAVVEAGRLRLVRLVELSRSGVEGVLLRLEAVFDVREMLLAVPKRCVLALGVLSVSGESLLVASAALFPGEDVSSALVECVHALRQVAREAIRVHDGVVESVHGVLEGVSGLVGHAGGKGSGGAGHGGGAKLVCGDGVGVQVANPRVHGGEAAVGWVSGDVLLQVRVGGPEWHEIGQGRGGFAQGASGRHSAVRACGDPVL